MDATGDLDLDGLCCFGGRHTSVDDEEDDEDDATSAVDARDVEGMTSSGKVPMFFVVDDVCTRAV